MPSPIQIVANTPLWVWPLMVFVIGVGCYGLRPRTVTPWRLGILPMIGVATSLAGILQSAQAGLALAAPLGYGIGRRRSVRLLDDGRLAIAGGWFMLLFGLSVFAVRYALGILFGFAALNPKISMSVQTGLGHMDMIADPKACSSVATLWRQLAGDEQARFGFKVREDMFAGMEGDAVAFERAMKLIADTLAAKPDHPEALIWRGDGRLFLAGRAFQRGAIAEGQALSAQALADMDRAVAANRYLDRMTGELPGTAYAKNAAARRADPAARVPLTCLGCH